VISRASGAISTLSRGRTPKWAISQGVTQGSYRAREKRAVTPMRVESMMGVGFSVARMVSRVVTRISVPDSIDGVAAAGTHRNP